MPVVLDQRPKPSDFPLGKPLSPVEAELREAWKNACEAHRIDVTPENWQRRIAASAAYQAVYDWNRSE